MYWDIIEKIEKEFSGTQAKRHAEAIYQWDHRADFKGFRKSSAYCADVLRDVGASNVEIIQYPADGRSRFGELVTKEAWDVNDAELKIVEPSSEARTIASYRDEPLTLVSFSAPTPPEGVEADVILVEQKLPDASDLKGKIAFVSQGSPHSQAVLEAGCLGYITDSVVEILHIYDAFDVPDAVHWASPFRPRNEKKQFGFSISARQGDFLVNLIKRMDVEGKKVRVRALVDAKLYEGTFPTVTAFIPGTGEEEILVDSHLYEPGAIDNASGCGLDLEMARTLIKLISEGKLPRPQRTIRFLLGLEFYSLAAYTTVHKEKAKNIIGSIYIDSVGASQEFSKAPLHVYKMPDAKPTYLDSVLFEMMQSYFEKRSPYYRIGAKPYFGNDTQVAANPAINIEMTSLIQFPFIGYHSSYDTPNMLTPKDMELQGTLASAYVYFLASASYPEVIWMVSLIATEGRSDIEREVQKAMESMLNIAKSGEERATERICEKLAWLDEWLKYKADRITETQKSVLKLVEAELKGGVAELLKEQEKEIRTYTTKRYDSIFSLIEREHQRLGLGDIQRIVKMKTPDEEKADSIIPKLVFPPRIPVAEWPKEDREKYKGSIASTALFWVDDKRSLLEIAGMIEKGGLMLDVKTLIEQFELLEKYGYVELFKNNRIS
jgi:hypothetical protein